MFLVFDTETTGLPKNMKAPINDFSNWPRIIELAWAMYDNHGNKFDHHVDLIRPDGWIIPREKFWLENGFTTERNEKNGIPILNALNGFVGAIDRCDYLIAHNIEFDYKILGSEMYRAGIRASKRLPQLCTKEIGTDVCKIPGKNGGYKWPKLNELHENLMGYDFDNAHNALADVEATARCFFALLEKGVINLPFI